MGIDCDHDWKVWPETDGQSQRCIKCGAYRDTPSPLTRPERGSQDQRSSAATADLIERLRNPMWAHSTAPFLGPQLEQEENLAAMNEAAAEIERLRAAPQSSVMWQPIDTAPKDKPIMLCVTGFLPCVGRWWTVDSCWASFDWDGHFESDEEMTDYVNGSSYEPTHWAPLVAGPSVTRPERGSQDQRSSAGSEDADWNIRKYIDFLRADEGDSVTILCDNPDFNGQPNCAIECCGDWTGWLHKRFAADTLLDTLSMAVTERNLPSPRKVIATSNGHHWVQRFNLVCCRDCGFVRRADDKNAPCKGPVGVGIRRDLIPDPAQAEQVRAMTIEECAKVRMRAEIKRKDGRLSEQECEGCMQWKMCRLFVLQDGHAAFICEGCRIGKTK